MNARRKRKLLLDVFSLIENRELTENDYTEIVQKLEREFKKGDVAVKVLRDRLSKIYKNPNKRNKIKAVRIAIEEFFVKVIAETIIRGTRGY